MKEILHNALKAAQEKALDKIMEDACDQLNGYGVEANFFKNDYRPGMIYVNMGDSYASTIIWDCINKEFVISSVGDLVEKHEKLGYKYM